MSLNLTTNLINHKIKIHLITKVLSKANCAKNYSWNKSINIVLKLNLDETGFPAHMHKLLCNWSVCCRLPHGFTTCISNCTFYTSHFTLRWRRWWCNQRFLIQWSFTISDLWEMWHVLLLFLVVIMIYLDTKKPKNFPKGPMWMPVIGSALKIANSRKETGMLIDGVAKIASEYPGEKNVVGFKVGKDKVVFATSTESIMEMFTNPDLDGRPYGPFYETRTWNLRRGILLTDEGLSSENPHRIFYYLVNHFF